MSAAARAGIALGFASALLAQGLLQGGLGRGNRVRASRRLDVAPSSLLFRLASGGVKEAAADGLWLTVLPRLARTWPDPDRKAAWIEAVTTVVVDATPRALHPVIYATYFLELVDRRHPAIERLVHRSMTARTLGPFGARETPNAGSWELPELLGMNLYIHGRTPEEKERALEYLRTAARNPDCPTLDISFVARLERDRGNDLAGTGIWLHRAESTDNPAWRAHYLGEADRERLRVLRKWAERFEERAGRWPRSVEELLGEAPETAVRTLEGNPALGRWFSSEVVLHPGTRDLEIPRVTAEEVEAGGEVLRALLDKYEAAFGERPPDLEALRKELLRPFPRPPLHGTDWALDPATGGVKVVEDPGDPRLRR